MGYGRRKNQKLSIAETTITENTVTPEDEADKYVLTDANGKEIEDESYPDSDKTIDARARLMATHPDGDEVTVEPRDIE